MKRLFLFIALSIVTGSAIFAQSAKEVPKERKELRKGDLITSSDALPFLQSVNPSL